MSLLEPVWSSWSINQPPIKMNRREVTGSLCDVTSPSGNIHTSTNTQRDVRSLTSSLRVGELWFEFHLIQLQTLVCERVCMLHRYV